MYELLPRAVILGILEVFETLGWAVSATGYGSCDHGRNDVPSAIAVLLGVQSFGTLRLDQREEAS